MLGVCAYGACWTDKKRSGGFDCYAIMALVSKFEGRSERGITRAH